MAPAASNSRNRVRIIGGTWRGSRLEFPDIDGLRPTADRTRETLFNWLQQDIYGSRCLDLFAGSGALGFEALSRGAAYALLLEKNSQAAHQLTQHKQRLKAENCDIQQIDAVTWLQNFAAARQKSAFDIIFLDPPYALNLIPECLQLLEKNACIRDGGLLYFEQPQHQEPVSVSTRWREIRHKRSGQVSYSLLRFGEQT